MVFSLEKITARYSYLCLREKSDIKIDWQILLGFLST